MSFIKLQILQIKYQVNNNWIDFEGITCIGVTHNFQNSAPLEYLPSLSNVKSSQIEGTDLIVFKLSYSYTLPKKVEQVSGCFRWASHWRNHCYEGWVGFSHLFMGKIAYKEQKQKKKRFFREIPS